MRKPPDAPPAAEGRDPSGSPNRHDALRGSGASASPTKKPQGEEEGYRATPSRPPDESVASRFYSKSGGGLAARGGA